MKVHVDVKPVRTEGMPRAVYISGWMMEMFSYTEDCSGDVATRAGMSVAKTHSAICSKRMEEEIGRTERGQKVMAKSDERWIHRTANEIKKKEAKKK